MMAFLTNFPADQREAEQSGGYWQPKELALAASFRLESAARWLRASEEATSMMATHAVTQAAYDIESAASLMKDESDIAWDATQLAWRCGQSMKNTIFPWTEGLVEAVEALQERVDDLLKERLQ